MPRSISRPPVTLQLVELLEESRTNRLSVDANAAGNYRAGSYRFARIGDINLLTDSGADGLCTARDGDEPVVVLQARDFSLYCYDLSSVRGRARVREYLRRKLMLLHAAVERDWEAYVRHRATLAARGERA